MDNKKNQQVKDLRVIEGLSVAVIPDSNHEFLMPSKEVAKGYGITQNALRGQKKRRKTDFIEGKHFISGVSIPNAGNLRREATFWTKRGIVRLGFFIKSDRARLFRDWAEDLVINTVESQKPVPVYDILKDFKQTVKTALLDGRMYYHFADTLLFIRERSSVQEFSRRDTSIKVIKLRFTGMFNESYFIELVSLAGFLKKRSAKGNKLAAALLKAIMEDVQQKVRSMPSFKKYKAALN